MFGERFKELRKSRKLTQGELANFLGISASTVGMYEQGRRQPDNDMLNRIASFFNVSSDYLLGKSSLDIAVMLEDFKAQLTNGGLMFNGRPISPEDAQNVLKAMEIGAKIALEKK